MLKNKTVRIVLVLLVAVIVAVGGYMFYDNIIVSSNTGAVTTGQPVAPTLGRGPAATSTPVALGGASRLISNFARPVNQTTRPYTSCTEDRKATPTPTGQPAAAATAAATMAATMSATMAATQAATAPAASSELIVFAIDGKESEACYQVGEVFINRNNQFALAVGVTTSIAGEIGIDKANVANSLIGEIVVDISQLASDQSSRDGQIRRRWLESNTFPLAKFVTKEITGLPARAYTEGETLNFTLKGDLFVREKARATEFTVQATLTKDGVLYGTAFTDALMTDWGFDPPEIGGVLKANNEVRIILNFVAREKK